MPASPGRRGLPEPLEPGAEERILAAACFEFARGGLGGTTMRQIADRAGVAHPLINYYFGNKESLWRRAAARLYGRVSQHLDEVDARSGDLKPRERIHDLLVEFVVVAASSRKLTFMIEASHDGGECMEWLQANFVTPVQERVLALLREGQRRRLVVPGPREFLYRVLTGFSISLATGDLLTGREHEEAEVRREAEQIVALVMPRPKRR